MSTATETGYIRHGVGVVRPYLYGHDDLLAFVQQVFRAREVERSESARGAHVEVAIGDSMVVLEVGEPPATATRSSVYVYVADVDAVYQRALRAGATSLAEPAEKPYGERNAGVKDTFGNTWWIGTYFGASTVAN
jgi:PhnB protein